MDSDGQQARIEELEAELARQIACREDSDRKLMAADDALNRTAYELAEARKDGERLDWLHERMAHVTEWTKGMFVVETRRYGGSRWMTKPIYKTPRAAIDAARAAEGGKG